MVKNKLRYVPRAGSNSNILRRKLGKRALSPRLRHASRVGILALMHNSRTRSLSSAELTWANRAPADKARTPHRPRGIYAREEIQKSTAICTSRTTLMLQGT